MTDSSDPTDLRPGYMASSAAFSTNTDEAKILSYMWYIHVTVRVNAADRLWDRLIQLLEQGIPTATAMPTTSASPPYSLRVDLDGINDASSSGGSGSRSTLGCEGDGANRIDDLTDYLVLRHFSGLMLARLVKTAPVEEHMDGYARVLAGVPAHLRVEFCRRLYCLLFSKYIIDWPPGIAVPDPAPGSIAAAAAAAAAAAKNTAATASSTGSETAVVDVDQKRKNEDDKKEGLMLGMDDIPTEDAKDDYVFDSESHKHLVSPEPASPGYQSTLGPSSPWPDTPSLGYSPELARAAYFGTASTPLPIQYLGDCERVSRGSSSSSRDDGPARAACAGAGASAGRHDERLPTPSWDRRHPPASPAPPQQHANNPQEGRPASLLRSAHIRGQQQVSHTGSCCPCRAREAWSHGVGGPR